MKRTMMAAVTAALVCGAALAGAAEVKVLSAGAMQAIVRQLAEPYKQETGNTVTISGGPVGVVRQKLTAGEPADVVIATDAAIDDMAKAGLVVPGTRIDLARTGVGVGVKDGAPKPDISTSEAFKRVMLNAKAVAYVDPGLGATSGIHVAGVFQRLGIADVMKPKSVLWPGGYAAEAILKGQAEIVPVKGVTLVGPLPKDLQKITVYSAGLPAKTTNAELGRGFLAFLNRAAFRGKFADAGLDYKEP